MSDEGVKKFDDWLRDDSEVAALVMRQCLVPVEGKDAVIFPPTYPIERNTPGYNIDTLGDGTKVAQVDSVGSQANRMEPIFKYRYSHLVPQVVIKTERGEYHLLDVGHRAADAIVLFSDLGLYDAFIEYRDKGNARRLAKIAPTSLVFGAWDSRSSQTKLPRIVRSVIRAYDVEELTRSAQYTTTIAGEIIEEGEAETKSRGKKSKLGLAHTPATRTPGGVLVKGAIRREAALNLSPLRALAGPADGDDTLKLRRYVLGLALVSLTAPMEPYLREGCELVPDPERPRQWTLVRHDGTREVLRLSHEDAREFAELAAESFGVGEDRSGEFDPETARWLRSLPEKKRKEYLRKGPMSREVQEKIGKRSKKKSRQGGAG